MSYIGIHTSFDIGEEVYFCWLKNDIGLFTVHEAKITEILVTTNDTGTTVRYRVAYVFSGVSRTCTAEEFELGRTYSSATKSCADELTKRSIKYFEEELNKSLSKCPERKCLSLPTTLPSGSVMETVHQVNTQDEQMQVDITPTRPSQEFVKRLTGSFAHGNSVAES